MTMTDPIAAIVETLYTEYADRIRRYVYRRTSSAELAEDICQDAFCRLLAALRGKADVRHGSGYLHRIAHNLVIDYYRHRDKMAASSIEAMSDQLTELFGDGANSAWAAGIDAHEALLDPSDLETDTAQRLDFADFLTGAERMMTEKQIVVLQMRYFEGCAFGEIAACLGMGEGAIKQLKHRGIASLRQRYAEVPAA